MEPSEKTESTAKYIVIEPDKELAFQRPFTAVVKQILTVTNNHPDTPVGFKVKTTAPKQYCVRPNAGRLLPGTSCEIQVLLQAMKEDPPLDFKCKDKFLVQTIKIPHDVVKLEGEALTSRLQELWTQAETVKKSLPEGGSEIIAEKKLRCVYLSPEDAVPSSQPLLLKKDVSADISRVSTLSSEPTESQPQSTTSTNLPPQPLVTATASDTVSVQTSVTPSPVKAELASPSKELQEAKEKIKSLQDACEKYRSEIERINTLRQRRGETPNTSVESRPQTSQAVSKPTESPSIQTILLVALFAFLLGVWLF